MANFLNDLGAALKKVASDVSSEVSIAGKEQNLKEAFQTLGRMYYQSAKKGEALSGAEFSAQMEKIELLKLEIRQLRSNQEAATESDFADL